MAAAPGEHRGPGDVQLRPAGEPGAGRQRVQDRQPGRRPLSVRDGDGPVRLDDRGRVEPEQLAVQRGDLPPVSIGARGRVGVAGGDGGLQLVRAGTAPGERRLGQRPSLGQAGPVPPAAVLVSEQDQRAVLVGPRGGAGAGEQDEREQPGDLGLIRQQPVQPGGEPQRLLAQVVPDDGAGAVRGMSLGEGEVDGAQHRRQAGWPFARVGHAQPDARVADLPLGPHDPLSDSGFGQQQQPRDGRRGHPAYHAQGEGHPRCRVQRRVAAREQQRQLVVAGDAAAVRARRGPFLHGFALLARTGALATQVIQRAAPRDRDDPAPGIGRQAITRPLLHSRRARLLHAVLCQRQVAGELGHRRRGGPPRGAQGPLDVPAQCGPITITGRTSTDPYLADGIIAAYRSAASRSSQSRM